MANCVWVGKQRMRPQVITITPVSGSDVTDYSIDIPVALASGGRRVTYTSIAGDAAADIAAGLQVLCAAVDAPGEFREITWAVSGSTLLATGPSDGAPIALVVAAATGTGTISRATTVAPQSPYSVSDAPNWSNNAVPTNADEIIFELSDVPVLYNTTALTAVTAPITRRRTYTGRIGLPREGNGYVQWRDLALETKAATVTWEAGTADGADQFRLNCKSAAAVTITVTGSAATKVGEEPLQIQGTPANSVLNVNGSGVSIAANTGETALFTTVRATNAALTLGAGLTLVTGDLRGVEAEVRCGYTTIVLDRGGTLKFTGAAAGTTTTIQEGAVSWQSTGGPGALTLGSETVFDAALAPAAFAVTSVALAGDSAALNDPGKRITRPFAITLTNTSLNLCRVDSGTGGTVTITA